jgi:protocatechuate 3,4-dioxygenase beta subunit
MNIVILALLTFVAPSIPSAKEEAVALCGPEEPGEKLIFSGRVLDYQGKPLAKAAVVAHHADREGLYVPKDSPTRVPRLKGVAITDEQGRFRFTSVRPGAYPDGKEPAHIHLSVVAPVHHVRFVAYWFEGDPLLSEQRRQAAARNSEIVIVKLTKNAEGVWTFNHDIRLEDN